jgi:peroxiredoxin Q/BCP
MQRPTMVGWFIGVLGLVWPGVVLAQDTPSFLAVGEAAPNIQVTGATRYGVLADPIRLNDFRGETVVLAFFFRARSPG